MIIGFCTEASLGCADLRPTQLPCTILLGQSPSFASCALGASRTDCFPKSTRSLATRLPHLHPTSQSSFVGHARREPRKICATLNARVWQIHPKLRGRRAVEAWHTSRITAHYLHVPRVQPEPHFLQITSQHEVGSSNSSRPHPPSPDSHQ